MSRHFVAASSQYIEAPGTPLVTAYPFSMSVWFKPTTVITTHLFVMTGGVGTTGYASIVLLSDGTVRSQIDSSDQAASFDATSGSGAITSGTWYRLTAVFTSATDRSLYVDNTKFTGSTSETFPVGLSTIGIGGLPSYYGSASPSNFNDCDTSDAAIWNVALDDDDVADLVSGIAAGAVQPGGLVHYWPLVTAGSTEPDTAGSHDGTVYGATSSDQPPAMTHTAVGALEIPAELSGVGTYSGTAGPRLSFRYFRLNFTRILNGGVIVPTDGATGNVRVAEFEIMYGTTPYPTSNMTAANAPAPLVASASGFVATFDPYYAFDGGLNDTSRWISDAAAPPYWIQIDLGSGNSLVPTGYRFAPDGAAASNYFALDWTLQGSNTGDFAGEETTLDTRTDVSSGWTNLTLRSFTVTLPPSLATSITLVDLNKKFYARDTWRKPWLTKVVSGTYTGGDPEFIEYQVHLASDSSVVQAWLPLVSPTIGGGNWSGTVRIPQGGEYNLSVRADSDPGVVANGTFDFAVGLAVLALGERNMVGMFDSSIGAPAANPMTYLWDGSWGSPSDTSGARLLNEINNATGVPCAFMHAAAVGSTVDYALSVANGGTSSPADGSTGKTWDDWITTRITAMGEPFEFVVWHQGEAGGDYYAHPTYAEKLDKIHRQVCTISGRTEHQVTFLVASINSGLDYTDSSYTTPVLHTAEQNIAHNLVQTALANTRHAFPHILLSHSSYGCAMTEETEAGTGNKIFRQYTDPEQWLNAARFGRTISAVLGGAQGGAIFEITHARTINATTTDLFVNGGATTDFTGKTSPSGLTGFEASGDNGTTWAVATAARLNATTIRVTHGALSNSSTRRVRYGYGWDAPITNPVVDTSAYASYLMPTPTRYGIAPQPLFQTAAPSFAESRVDTASATPYPITDVPIGKWIHGDKVVVVGMYAAAGTSPQTLTITPNAGVPVVATLIAGTSSYVQFWVATINGYATSIDFVRSGTDIGQGRYAIWWVPKVDLASITPTSASSHVASATSVSTTLTFPANSIIFGAAGFGWTGGTLTTTDPFAQRFSATNALFFDRCNATLSTSSSVQVSGSGSNAATVQVLAFQANSVSVTQTPQAHNGGKWQVNVMFPSTPSEFPFANVLKSSPVITDPTSAHVSPSNVSAQGYALPGQAIKFVDMFIPTQSELPGNYRLRWKGTATISAVGGTVVSGSLSGTDGEAVLSIPSTSIGIDYTGHATDPVYEMSLVHEDYCASYDGGNIWNPRFIERLLECRPGTIRFLDWIFPNSACGKWEHRKPLDYSIWAGNEYRGSLYLTTTNVGNAFTTSGSGGVLTHGEMAIVRFNAAITAPTTTATLNWKGTGAKPIRELSGYPIQTLYWELVDAGTYHTCIYDSVLDCWLMEGFFAWQHYPLLSVVPPEAIIDLCNRVGANCWIPIPYVTTDPLTDYIPKLAACAREQLHPWLKMFNEPGNEWWNTDSHYPCTHWGENRGVLAYGPNVDDFTGYRFYNQATANLGRTLATVFVNDRRRFSCVSAGQGLATSADSVGSAYAQNLWRYTRRVKGEAYHTYSGEYAQPWVVDICTSDYWSAAYRGTAEETTYNVEYATATPTRKAEILNEYTLGPFDTPENLYRHYSGRPPYSTFPVAALQFERTRTYDTWGQIAAENGHGLVAYEGGLWTDGEVGLDARQLGTAVRDLQRFDFQNWLDAGGTFPSQYWLASPRWNVSLLWPSIYAADSPGYLGVLDFNNALSTGLLITTEAGAYITTEGGDRITVG